jgi:hypothetical protein
MKKANFTPRSSLPVWDLQLVLEALMGLPFEPMDVSDDECVASISYKTAFLLAVVSAKRVGELQAFSSDKRYLRFAPNGVTLRLNPKFIPKVNTSKNREQSLFFTPFCPRNDPPTGQTFYRLCLRRCLQKYLQVTAPFRAAEQLFVCFRGTNRGQAASKATISRWVRTAIQLAYKASGKSLPTGIKAHQTICDTASWSNESTFVRHYQLNLAGDEPSARFGNAVLQTVLDGRPQ